MGRPLRARFGPALTLSPSQRRAGTTLLRHFQFCFCTVRLASLGCNAQLESQAPFTTREPVSAKNWGPVLLCSAVSDKVRQDGLRAAAKPSRPTEPHVHLGLGHTSCAARTRKCQVSSCWPLLCSATDGQDQRTARLGPQGAIPLSLKLATGARRELRFSRMFNWLGSQKSSLALTHAREIQGASRVLLGGRGGSGRTQHPRVLFAGCSFPCPSPRSFHRHPQSTLPIFIDLVRVAFQR